MSRAYCNGWHLTSADSVDLSILLLSANIHRGEIGLSFGRTRQLHVCGGSIRPVDKSKTILVLRRQRRREQGGGSKIVVRLLAGLLVFMLLCNLAVLFMGACQSPASTPISLRIYPTGKRSRSPKRSSRPRGSIDRTGEHLLYEVFDRGHPRRSHLHDA